MDYGLKDEQISSNSCRALGCNQWILTPIFQKIPTLTPIQTKADTGEAFGVTIWVPVTISSPMFHVKISQVTIYRRLTEERILLNWPTCKLHRWNEKWGLNTLQYDGQGKSSIIQGTSTVRFFNEVKWSKSSQMWRSNNFPDVMVKAGL
jgi:hypothetical protein